MCAGALARVRMDIPQLTFSLAADFRSEHGHHSNRFSPVLIDFFLPKNKVLLPDHSAHAAFAPKTENWTEVATQLQGLLKLPRHGAMPVTVSLLLFFIEKPGVENKVNTSIV